MWIQHKLIIINKLVVIIIFFCWISSCRKDSDTPSAESLCPPISGDSTNISYSRSVKPILEKHCITCHKSGNSLGNVLLEDYSSVRQYAINGKLAGAIGRKAGYSPMPPGQELPSCLTNPVITWINEGSKNN